METALHHQPVFRSAVDRRDAEVALRGALPEWLRGDLVRTAPALFQQGSWRADHWFDGLGLIYSFRLGQSGVRFRQQALESVSKRRIDDGFDDHPHFGTSMHRGFFRRLFQPIPPPNDNTNVNCLAFGDRLVALTETNVQHEIDRDTLRSRGHVKYEDEHGDGLFMIAHPHADFSRGKVVNVASDLSARAALVVYEHPFSSMKREVIARLPRSEVPYVHSFGLTGEHVALIEHPWLVSPIRLLWSDKGFRDHFRWRPERGTVLTLLSRGGGETRRHTAPPMFVFHTINMFERGDETVLDVLAYDDAGIVERFSTRALAEQGPPDLRAKPTRIVMTKGREEARVEPLGDVGFEFPQVSYKRCSGQSYEVVWGAEDVGARSAIVRVEVNNGRVTRFSEANFVFGEPVFVAEPGASSADRGVILTVGSHVDEPRSALAVLDATTLDRLAWAEVNVPIPLGFHGSFVRG